MWCDLILDSLTIERLSYAVSKLHAELMKYTCERARAHRRHHHQASFKINFSSTWNNFSLFTTPLPANSLDPSVYAIAISRALHQRLALGPYWIAI